MKKKLGQIEMKDASPYNLKLEQKNFLDFFSEFMIRISNGEESKHAKYH